MISFTSKGSWQKTESWLKRAMRHNPYRNILHKYGERGVIALRNNTPVLTGTTAESWYYQIIEERRGKYKIIWCNRNLEDDWYNVALYIQLGHATAQGTWVEGTDYINPALAKIFDKLADEAWKEVNDPSLYNNRKI